MKKMLTMCIAVFLCFVMCFSANAANIDNSKSQLSKTYSIIAQELFIYEGNKEYIGLENVDFTNLGVSNKICVYEYTTDSFNEIAEAYLLFDGNKAVSLAYLTNQAPCQFFTFLANKIAGLDEEKFAIVYDRKGCYLYNGKQFRLVCLSGDEVTSRDSLENRISLKTNGLKLSSANRIESLMENSLPLQTRTQTNFSCNIKYVTQNPYGNICWAASTAMIANYKNGTTYSAQDVAKAYFGTDFNKALSLDKITVNMNSSRYHLGYTYKYSAPSDNTILWNIQNKYPIVGAFKNYRNGHAVVVYGINVIAGRIAVMDPVVGSRTCYRNSSGKYYFTVSSTGKEYELTYGICKAWK